MAYATASDVETRTTREFSRTELDVITSLLDDVAILIDGYNANASAEAKQVVSCRVVLRAIGAGDAYGVPMGATQGSMTAGPYSQSWTISSGGSIGELYLGRTDKQLLGGGSRIGSASPVEGLVRS